MSATAWCCRRAERVSAGPGGLSAGRRQDRHRGGRTDIATRGSLLCGNLRESRLVIPTQGLESGGFPRAEQLCRRSWRSTRPLCGAAARRHEAAPASLFPGTKSFPCAPTACMGSAVPCEARAVCHLPAACWSGWAALGVLTFPAEVLHWSIYPAVFCFSCGRFRSAVS